ncbi:MAG: penicillin-binding protein 2 [Alphaproteobacteria bacterium]|nr:penicillin-binding protein 2 [Alphaproteobacteria bacterium]
MNNMVKNRTDDFNVGKEIKHFLQDRTPSGLNTERIKIFYITCLALCFFLTGSTFFTIFIKSSSSNNIIYQKDSCYRPTIFDRNGVILAQSILAFDFAIQPNKVENINTISKKLKSILPSVDLSKLDANKKFVYIKRNVDIEVYTKIKSAIGHFKGVQLIPVKKRIYPIKSVEHIIGTADDCSGKTKLEYKLNPFFEKEKNDAFLTIDSRIQRSLNNQLESAIRKFKAKGAFAIIMDVKTNEIIALVSNYENSHYRIEPIDGRFELGSVLKVFNTACALATDSVTVDEVFDIPKSYKIGKFTVKDAGRHKHDELSVKDIFKFSSNVGSIKIAEKMGIQNQKKCFEKLGIIGKQNFVSSIKLVRSGEPKEWSKNKSLSISYGYGLSINPITMLVAFNATINGGLLIQPSLLKNRSVDKSERILLPHISSQILQILHDATGQGGTASRVKVLDISIGAKTGTANKFKDGKYNSKSVYTSILVVLPIQQPQYSMLIVLDEPQTVKGVVPSRLSYYNVVPTAHNILEEIIPLLDIYKMMEE